MRHRTAFVLAAAMLSLGILQAPAEGQPTAPETRKYISDRNTVIDYAQRERLAPAPLREKLPTLRQAIAVKKRAAELRLKLEGG